MDKDQAQTILEKDLANIVAKSKEGKPLTKAERDALAMSTAKDTKQYSINALFDPHGGGSAGVETPTQGRQTRSRRGSREVLRPRRSDGGDGIARKGGKRGSRNAGMQKVSQTG
jgi:hypothetical protein